MTSPGRAARRWPRATRSLSARFLAIAVGGVLAPLILVGVWLTRSAERAGTTLLQGQLADAGRVLAARFDSRWVMRNGELQLLASNSSAVALMTGGPLAAADSAYLRDMIAGLQPAIIEVVYRDAAGRVRWSSAADGNGASTSRPFSPDPSFTSTQAARSFTVRRAVVDSGGEVGTVSARIRLSSVLPLDSAPLAVPSGTITIMADAQRLWSSAPDTIDVTAASIPLGWAVDRRVLSLPSIELIVAAPSTAFVAPFKQVTSIGLLVLAGVAVIVLLFTVVLTRRVTRSLARLADAAAAVSAGDLNRSVTIDSDDEIGQLAAAFNSMSSSLRHTLSELSQQRALAAVGEFATTLSHEVRNSLTAVRVDLQHVARHLPRTEPQGVLVGRALDSVRRLDGTVTSALRVARSGTMPMRVVSLADVIDQAVAVSAPIFAERDVILERPSMAMPILLHGDAAALEQLFVNLLLNAAQAMERGGTATIRARSEANDPALIHIEIADTGDGMPLEYVGNPDQRFRSTKPYGTGLGLPLAQRIAQMHGGTLTIHSHHGTGTTIVVTLPIHRAGQQRANSADPAHQIEITDGAVP